MKKTCGLSYASYVSKEKQGHCVIGSLSHLCSGESSRKGTKDAKNNCVTLSGFIYMVMFTTGLHPWLYYVAPSELNIKKQKDNG